MNANPAVLPRRLQLSHRKRFNLQRHSRAVNGLAAVKVDRKSQFGNAFRVGAPVDMWLVRRWGWKFKHPEFHDYVRCELGGKNLACWCHLCAAHRDGKLLGVECAACDPCHADIELEIANR